MPTPYRAIRERQPAVCPKCGCQAGQPTLRAEDPSEGADYTARDYGRDTAEGCLERIPIIGWIVTFKQVRHIARSMTSMKCEACGHIWPR